jgi:hypothetical protein
MHLVERNYSTFTTEELARLAVYRAAVEAGFYTDWDGSEPRPEKAPPAPPASPEASAESGETSDEPER